MVVVELERLEVVVVGLGELELVVLGLEELKLVVVEMEKLKLVVVGLERSEVVLVGLEVLELVVVCSTKLVVDHTCHSEGGVVVGLEKLELVDVIIVGVTKVVLGFAMQEQIALMIEEGPFCRLDHMEEGSPAVLVVEVLV